MYEIIIVIVTVLVWELLKSFFFQKIMLKMSLISGESKVTVEVPKCDKKQIEELKEDGFSIDKEGK